MTLTVTAHEHEWVYVGETPFGFLFECAGDFCPALKWSKDQ